MRLCLQKNLIQIAYTTMAMDLGITFFGLTTDAELSSKCVFQVNAWEVFCLFKVHGTPQCLACHHYKGEKML